MEIFTYIVGSREKMEIYFIPVSCTYSKTYFTFSALPSKKFDFAHGNQTVAVPNKVKWKNIS